MKKQLLMIVACLTLLQSSSMHAMDYVRRGREYVTQVHPVRYAQQKWQAGRIASMEKVKNLADWMSSLSQGLRNSKSMQDVRKVLAAHKKGIIATAIIVTLATFLGVRMVEARTAEERKEERYKQLEREAMEAPVIGGVIFREDIESVGSPAALRKEPVTARPTPRVEPSIKLTSKELAPEPGITRMPRRLALEQIRYIPRREPTIETKPFQPEVQSPILVTQILNQRLNELQTYSGTSLWNEIALIIKDAQMIQDVELETRAINIVLDDLGIEYGPLSQEIAKAFLMDDSRYVSLTEKGKTRGVKQGNWNQLIQLAPSQKVIEEVKSKIHFQ